MKLKYKKPITSSLRHTVLLYSDFTEKNFRLKNLIIKKKRKSGRNNQGKITCFTKGGGHKRLIRLIININFILYGIVESIEYDPNRNASVARLFINEQQHVYMIACAFLNKGHFIQNYSNIKNFKLYLGSFYNLGQLPLGSNVYNVNFPSKKSQMARSAGCSLILVAKSNNICRMKLPSGKERIFSTKDLAILGVVSNGLFKYQTLGKAGRSRWLNRRPKVRGVAMNPIDHPHGGGEGKTSGGRPSVTPWGKVAKGQPTCRKHFNKYVIIK